MQLKFQYGLYVLKFQSICHESGSRDFIVMCMCTNKKGGDIFYITP